MSSSTRARKSVEASRGGGVAALATARNRSGQFITAFKRVEQRRLSSPGGSQHDRGDTFVQLTSKTLDALTAERAGGEYLDARDHQCSFEDYFVGVLRLV